MEHSSFTCCLFIFIIYIYIYIFFFGGGRGELCCSTPVLLYKYLQYVYFDPSIARFYNLPVKGVTHFYNVCLFLCFYSFCVYFTCFLVYILSFYLICCLMLWRSVSLTVLFIVSQLRFWYKIVHQILQFYVFCNLLWELFQDEYLIIVLVVRVIYILKFLISITDFTERGRKQFL